MLEHQQSRLLLAQVFTVIRPASHVVRSFYADPVCDRPSPVMVSYSQCWYVHSCKAAPRRAEYEVRVFASPRWRTRPQPDVEGADNIQDSSAKRHICAENPGPRGNECLRRKYPFRCKSQGRDRQISWVMQQYAPTAIVNASARERVKDIVQK